MGTETKYRVGLLCKLPAQNAAMNVWMGPETDPLEISTFEEARRHSAAFPPQLAMTWVQVLAARHDCVLVERVEVAHA
ncbi:MAG TPA: hypothetical protein DD411_06275 [Alcanivorax sp.]|jgi:hypothetical protein|nr:hypothetical protein [Alcanivorax sp.]|tara:strand:+ start:803 stop:1036 length:234 start_codon:yes stop_codon:yes gene_type:complete